MTPSMSAPCAFSCLVRDYYLLHLADELLPQHAACSMQRCGFARLHLCTLASLHYEGAIMLHVGRLAEPGVNRRGSYTCICPHSMK